MTYCNAEGAPRKPGLTENQKLDLRIASKYSFYAVARDDVQTLELRWFEDNNRWISTGETGGFYPFVSLAGPRILLGFPRYPHGGSIWTIETNWDRSNDPFAYHVAILRQSQVILAGRLPNWFAIEWLHTYRKVFTSPDQRERYKAPREFWNGTWQPELISLLGPSVLEGSAE